MTAYDRYCYSIGKAPGDIVRLRFDAVYNMLVQSFKRVTGRVVVPVDADTVIFIYVSTFMQQADKGTLTSERLGDYTYIRENVTVTELLSDFEAAVQEYVIGDTLPIGMATEDSIHATCPC